MKQLIILALFLTACSSPGVEQDANFVAVQQMPSPSVEADQFESSNCYLEVNRDVSNTAPTNSDILDYCELANNPEKYDGQILRVRAMVSASHHGHSFYDPSCGGMYKQAAVDYDNDRFKEFHAKLSRSVNKKIVVVGKFSRVTPSNKTDALIHTTYLRFDIAEIETTATSSKPKRISKKK